MHAVIAAHLPGHLPAVHAAAVHGLHGQPLAAGVILAVVAAVMWHHKHHWERVIAWLFAASAACFTVAIPPFFDAMAALPTYGAGMVAFLIIAAFGIVGFWLQAIRSHRSSRFGGLFGKLRGGKGKPGTAMEVFSPVSRPNRYRRIGTPAVSIVAGVVFVVVLGAWRLILKSASVAIAGTLQQLATSARQVNNGHAAAAAPPSQRPGIYIGAVIVFVVIIMVMRSLDKRKGGRGRGAYGGGD